MKRNEVSNLTSHVQVCNLQYNDKTKLKYLRKVHFLHFLKKCKYIHTVITKACKLDKNNEIYLKVKDSCFCKTIITSKYLSQSLLINSLHEEKN